MKRILHWIPDEVRHSFKTAFWAGSKYHCPFCAYSSRALSVIGLDFPVLNQRQVIGAGRRKGGCFNCGSIDRERLIYLYLRDRLGLFDEERRIRILHVAPERNLSARLSSLQHAEYVGADKFAEGYRYPPHIRNIDILSIPYGEDHFDLIICNHVLEHIPDDRRAIAELFRVLKPGGQAILLVPLSKNSAETIEDPEANTPELREKRFGQFDHVRIYGQDYAERLRAGGFRVQRINLGSEPAYTNCGLNPDEDLFIGWK